MRKILFFLLPFTLSAQIPAYYDGLDFRTEGEEVKNQLSTLIKATHQALSYTPGVWNVLDTSDLDPDTPSKDHVLLIYGYDNNSVDKNHRTRHKSLKNNGTGTTTGKWEREHVYPKSLAVPKLETNYPGTGTDVHNLRAVDRQMNSSRGNNPFREKVDADNGLPGNIDKAFYPGDEWTGDVARILMYMYVHYDLETDPQKLADDKTALRDRMPLLFLKWNKEDKVSEFEKVRNDVIELNQGNRNPFIDNPYLATLIWGGESAENNWQELSNVDYDLTLVSVEISPNPTSDKATVIAPLFKSANLYDMNGSLLQTNVGKEINLSSYPAGIYILAVHLENGQIVTKKIIKK